jgi:hypothetical protein
MAQGSYCSDIFEDKTVEQGTEVERGIKEDLEKQG